MVRVNWCCGLLMAIAIAQGLLPMETIQASPWNSIVESFSRRPKPPLGGRSDFCAISPRLLKEEVELVSGDRLLFVWNGIISKIEVHAEGVDEPLWSQVVSQDVRQAMYTGFPLIAGARYEWWIFNRFAVNDFVARAVNDSGDSEFLLELYEKRVELAPTVPQNWASLAFIHYQKQEVAEAVSVLKRAATAIPSFAKTAECFSANIEAGNDPQAGC